MTPERTRAWKGWPRRLPGGRALEGAVWYQQTDTEGMDADQSAWGFRAALPSSEGINAAMDHEVFQANFNPALGFVNRGNIGRT